MMKRLFAGLVCASLAGAANATEWNPSAELGLVYTSGNSDTFNFNAKAALHGEDETWVHDFYVLGLRSEVDDDVSANRYEAGARSGYKFGEKSYWFGSLRYENDDFAPFEWQVELGPDTEIAASGSASELYTTAATQRSPICASSSSTAKPCLRIFSSSLNRSLGRTIDFSVRRGMP